MIGIAASMLLRLNGRIAGISGIVSGLLPPWTSTKPDYLWRAAFLLGLIAGAGLIEILLGGRVPTIDASLPLVVIGGLIAGIGTRIGGGCTSGHGVCGIARLSARSIAATVTFFGVTAVTVFVMQHVVG